MIQQTTLENGVRIISEHVPYVESIALGVWVGVGAKYEQPDEYGVTHFIEHMLFKGTSRRTAQDIADEIASVGGHINAATDREYTTFYVRMLKESLPLALDVLGDMLLNSSFDPEELEREKDVIFEEIKRHEDMPEDHVHDILTEITWGQHQLGHPVIGSVETVGSRMRENLINYTRSHYTAGRVVISAAGNLDHQHLLDLASPLFGSLPPDSPYQEIPKAIHHSATRIVDKATEAVYFCLGTPGFTEHDEKIYPLALLDTILGGGMSSRLFQEVREKRGLAYDIGSYRISYNEAGLFAVYGGTSVDTLGQVIDIVRKEFAEVSQDAVSDVELNRAKTQIRGTMLLAQENMGSRMSRLGKSLLDYNRYISVDEVLGKIQAVTADDLVKISQDILDPAKTSMAVIGPEKKIRKVLGN